MSIPTFNVDLEVSAHRPDVSRYQPLAALE
jgi:hypothetical protein